MKLRTWLLAAAVALALPAIAYADGFDARDGNNNHITKAAKNVGGQLHDLSVSEGLIGGNGNVQPLNVDSSGYLGINCITGCSGGGSSLNTLANASPSAVSEGSTTTPLSLDLNRNLRVVFSNASLAATQSGTWNITNISGTISLPTLAATSTKQSDGSQKTQIVDGSGNVIASTSNNLNVQCANCSGSGVSTADGATFTAGSSLFAGVGGIFQTTATSNPLTNGKQGLAQLTANRALMVNLRDSSGVEISPATAAAQTTANTSLSTIATNSGTQATAANQTSVIGTKAAGTAASNSLLAGGVYNSAGITLTNGQQAALQFTSTGALVVTGGGGAVTIASGGVASGGYASGAFASGSISNGADVVEGTQTDTTCSTTHTISGCLYAAANNTGVVKGAGTAGTPDSGVLSVQGVSSGTPMNTSDAATSATGSAVPSKAAYVGANSGGNLTGIVQADSSAKVSISTNTITQVVALSSGKKIYVTNFGLHSAGTTTSKWVYGTGTNCGTGTTDLTDLYDLTASDGMVLGSGLGPVLVVPASNALCISNSASVHVGGSVAYTQF